MGTSALGFRARRGAKAPDSHEELFTNATPDDLLEYGLIPEFVGRLTTAVSLHPLDKAALIRVLTEPKNAIVKQYQRFFALDHVELSFSSEALEAAAEEAMRHKTGARGLRSIMEETLLEIMYEIPSRGDVQKCVVGADTIVKKTPPLLVTRGSRGADGEERTLREAPA